MKLKDEVLAFFEWASGLEVTEDTQINNDLGVMGIDADEALESFSVKFKVDMDAFPYEEYFLDELGLLYMYYKFFDKKKLLKKPLTVGHMVKVAEKGTWFPPKTAP